MMMFFVGTRWNGTEGLPGLAFANVPNGVLAVID
jgi:hypothetical protein